MESNHPTISVAMIVKNEEAVLETCLKSIVGVDEIVILDTGSTDKTGEIARRYTDKYIEGEYAWNDNFAEAYNESFKRCTGDWILSVDADERLEDGGIEKIKTLLGGIPLWIDAISFDIINEGNSGGYLKYESVRLIRNNRGIVWRGVVHACLDVMGVLSSGIRIYHRDSPSHARDPGRTLRILTKEIEKNPTLIRERFYLAREYFERKEWEIAIEHYTRYLENAFWKPEICEAWMQIARCFNQMGMIQLARRACLRAIDLNPDFRDGFLMMAFLTQDDPEISNKWLEYATLAKNTNTLFCYVSP